MTKIELIQAIIKRIQAPSVLTPDDYHQLRKSVQDKEIYFDGVQLTSKGRLVVWYSKYCDSPGYSIGAIGAAKLPKRILQNILIQPFEH